jgi:hypothetical protein
MTQKIQLARSGDRLSASYINKIVDAANLAIDVIGPPRSVRLSSNDSFAPALDESGDGAIDGAGTRVYTETSRISSLVRVTDPQNSDVYVDIERIDQVTLRAGNDTLTLVFDN